MRLPSVAMRRNSASARRSLELFTSMLPAGGKTQAKVSAAMAVAMSPLSKPSNLETANTTSKSRSIDASLPMFSRLQIAAMQSRAIVERRVPGRDRNRNRRARSSENAAPMESIKKVPQTPRRHPAISPAVKPPITSPLEREPTPVFPACQSTSKSQSQKRKNLVPLQNVRLKIKLPCS